MNLGGRRGTDPYVPGHGDASYDVLHYDLDLTYAVGGNHLEGRAMLTCRAAEDDLDRVLLDLHGLHVEKVRVAGRPARYTHKANTLTVRLPETLPAGEEVEVWVRWSGNPAPFSKRHLGSAGWEQLADGVIVAAQPHGAPSWFPCNDRPSTKATYRMSITTSSEYTVVANGSLVERVRASRDTTWVYDEPRPMATYLATVQIGRYDLVDLDSEVPVVVAVPPAMRPRLADAFGRQTDMLAFFSKTYGEYPFAEYRVVVTEDELEIPLESQGLSTFGSNLLRPDWDAVRLVAHELSHQWFGNSLTLREWKDIWLHEGFACYSEWLWSEESGEASCHDRALEHWKRLADLPQDLVLADPGPELMFDDRVYKRGALFLHALRLTAGDDEFFAMLRSWVAGHAYEHVTTEQFLAHAADRLSPDLTRLAQAWLDETALPELPPAA